MKNAVSFMLPGPSTKITNFINCTCCEKEILAEGEDSGETMDL